jgi:hypothetical protein
MNPFLVSGLLYSILTYCPVFGVHYTTPFLTQGKRFDYYIQKMEKITIHANEIMLKLDQVGEALRSVKK